MSIIDTYQTDRAWSLCQGLPVVRFGYKHNDNGTAANSAYRASELAVWKAAHSGAPFWVLQYVWRVGNNTMMRSHVALDKIIGR